MDVTIQGKGKITLSPSDFKAAGGEGAVYVKSGTAYKIYGQSDTNGKFIFAPQKMIPTGKIQELAVLREPSIIKPCEILFEKTGKPIGYTMRALPDAIPLCQTFTKAYKDRNHLTPDHMLKLVQKLQFGVKHIHSQGILVVDLNEMNFLVDSRYEQVYFIDVDSYQTAHYPATAIMESIRDRHNSTFSQGTDWFSFGIVSFQMLVGIHPYKGKHPQLTTLDERMRANTSVLNSSVTVPGVCPPLTIIPQVYRDWYEAVFERGERIPPPDSLTNMIVLQPVVNRVTGSDIFQIEAIGDFDGIVVSVVGNSVLTTESIWAGMHRIGSVAAGSVLGVTPIHNHPVIAWQEQNELRLFDATQRLELDLAIYADEIMATFGRVYVRQGDLLMEVSFTEMPTRILAGVDVVGNILGQSTQLFEGVAVQSLLGAVYLGLLPESGKFNEVRMPELDGYRIVDAKFERGVFVAIGLNAQGQYDRLVFRFDATLKQYDLRTVPDITPAGVNFTVLDTGVVALMNEDEDIELFAKSLGSSTLKILRDKSIDGSCRLFSRGAQTLFARNDTLYKITIKPPP